MRYRTRLTRTSIRVASITPNQQVINRKLAALAALGKRHGVLTVIDNTFATPINQNPIPLGIDAVIHSATKYLNGHSDVNARVVVASADIVSRVMESAVSFGGMLDAYACSQLERGLKTLALRVQRHNENAGTLARFLVAHPVLAMMVFMSLVPAGVYQAWASISEGVWFARSPAFVHSSLMETFVWLRVPGDIVFALGTLFLAIFAGRLLIVRRNPAAVANANAFAGKTM